MEFIKVPGSAESFFESGTIDVLAIVLLLAVLFVIRLYVRPRGGWSSHRHWRRPKGGPRSGPSLQRPFPFPSATDVADPAQQMHMISKVGFETVPLLNREEYRVYQVLERTVAERRDGYRLMAQTSLGEIIRPKEGLGTNTDRDLAYRSINSKRLDFAIFDRSGRLAVAIEYQGSGHYHAKSFMRDAVKKEALRKAGVPLLEVPTDFRSEELVQQVHRALPGHSPASSAHHSRTEPTVTAFPARGRPAAD